MTHEEIVKAALDEGFENAAIIETKDMVFCEEFRACCEENRCGQYGANYSCPPDCGTVAQMREKALRWKYALVMTTTWEANDILDEYETKPMKAAHNTMSRTLIDRLRAKGVAGTGMTAGGCSKCSPCAKVKGEPCRFPDEAYSCMSAYCINVVKLNETAGLDFVSETNRFSMYSLFLFND